MFLNILNFLAFSLTHRGIKYYEAPLLVFFLAPTKPHMERQARTGDTVFVKNLRLEILQVGFKHCRDGWRGEG
jgi:hypothetical protein